MYSIHTKKSIPIDINNISDPKRGKIKFSLGKNQKTKSSSAGQNF
jgi:hypothetical protein